MAVEDVYSLRQTIEIEEGDMSINVHYQVLTDASLGGNPIRLAHAWEVVMHPLLKALLTTVCNVRTVVATKLSAPKEVTGKRNGEILKAGTVSGASLPGFNSANFHLLQTLRPANHNGLIWIPAVPSDFASGQSLTQTALDTVYADLANALLANLPEAGGGDGLYRLVVLSRQHLVLNPGDYAGAAADVTGVIVKPRIGVNNRRRWNWRPRPPQPVPPAAPQESFDAPEEASRLPSLSTTLTTVATEAPEVAKDPTRVKSIK